MIMVADWRKTSNVSDEKDLRIMELEEIIRQQDRKIVYTQGRVVDLEGEIKKTRKVRASAQEVVELDPSLVNWNEPGVNHIFEVFRTRFEQVEARMGTVMEENKTVMEENKTVMEENKKLRKTVQDLTAEIKQLKKNRKRSGGSTRSYNNNKRKRAEDDTATTTEYDDIRRKAWTGASSKLSYTTDGKLRKVAAVVDIKTCYACGNKLSNSHTEYPRETRDTANGRWTETGWTVRRRYCRKCDIYCSADPPGTLPNEKLGVNAIAQISIMRCMGITYDKIAQLFQMMYGERLAESTLIGICERTARRFWPVYNSLLDQIINSEIIGGDESGWFLNGTHYWVWLFLSTLTAFYHISHTRGKVVPTTLLRNFCGMVVSDSYAAWNHIGTKHQKCIIHYFRDLYNTLDRNKNAEFVEFAGKMIPILKDMMGARLEWSRVVPVHIIQELQARIDHIIDGTYQDSDCKRWVKRLRRERSMMLTFLGYDIVPFHNNGSERALRPVAVARKMQYGSRSKSGLVTTAVLMTAYETCKMRGINPYKFFIDYLNNKTTQIPMPSIPIMVAA